MDPQLLKEKIALITGSSSGVGAEAARMFAREGATVIVNYNRTEEGASEVIRQIESSGGKAIKIRADVSSSKEVSGMFEEISSKFGRLDILVNNAGVHMRTSSYTQVDEAMWDRLVDINMKGPWLCIVEAGKLMLKQRSGSIVNVTSMTNIMGIGSNVAYAAAKAGQVTLTRTFARQFAPYVRVNCVGLGIVETRMIGDMKPERRKFFEDLAILKRLGKPEEIANVMLFLASDLSSYITGQTISADGGEFTVSP
ncbi:MAG: glucose 1-dehydrogenase [Nitrososphaerota archaeon]|nr:glucose 1-dehydrogenase [Nitrososphaerota archaeon]